MSVTPPTSAARSVSPPPVTISSSRGEPRSASGIPQCPQESPDDVAATLAADFFARFDRAAGGPSTRSAGSHSGSSSYHSINTADDSSDDDSETERPDNRGLDNLTFAEILRHVGDNTPEKQIRGRRGSNATTTSSHSGLSNRTVDSRVESGIATADVLALLTLAQNDLLEDEEFLEATMQESNYRFGFGTNNRGTYIELSSIRSSSSQKYVMHNDPNTNLSWTAEQFTAMQTAVTAYYAKNSGGGGAAASVERR